jgi:AcrR family transcriptional regulator
LIAQGGVVALTTRAVAGAAGIQAPTLYRLFGDKSGLLHAVAEHQMAVFVAGKSTQARHPDPVQDLQDGWDAYIAFGLSNPAAFTIMNEIGSPEATSPATRMGLAVLQERVDRLARAGRLRLPVDRAVALIHAVGLGTVATLLSMPEDERDPELARLARDAVFSTVLVQEEVETAENLVPLAISLRARLGEMDQLSPGEKLLLSELLERLSR